MKRKNPFICFFVAVIFFYSPLKREHRWWQGWLCACQLNSSLQCLHTTPTPTQTKYIYIYLISQASILKNLDIFLLNENTEEFIRRQNHRLTVQCIQ